jgi:hypothetical protein
MFYFIIYTCLFSRFNSALACYLFQGYQAKKVRNRILDWAYTPTDGSQNQWKSHAASTWSIRPVCTYIRAIWSPSEKNLQKRRRFNVAIPFQLGWSPSYKSTSSLGFHEFYFGHHFHLSFIFSTLSPQTLATDQSQRRSEISAARSPERR